MKSPLSHLSPQMTRIASPSGTANSLTTAVSAFSLMWAFAHIVFMSLIYYYLYRLDAEKCECALSPQYTLLKRMVIVLLFFSVIMWLISLLIAFHLIYTPRFTGFAAFLAILNMVMFVVEFVFVILSIRYVRHLSAISCQCSDNGYRLMYFIYSIFRLVLLSFGLIAIIGSIVFVASLMRRLKQ